jgi:hypothetical protein
MPGAEPTLSHTLRDEMLNRSVETGLLLCALHRATRRVGKGRSFLQPNRIRPEQRIIAPDVCLVHSWTLTPEATVLAGLHPNYTVLHCRR